MGAGMKMERWLDAVELHMPTNVQYQTPYWSTADSRDLSSQLEATAALCLTLRHSAGAQGWGMGEGAHGQHIAT